MAYGREIKRQISNVMLQEKRKQEEEERKQRELEELAAAQNADDN